MSDIDGGGRDFVVSDFFAQNAAEKLEQFGTVRARLGYLINNDLLIYGTGGLAYGEIGRSGDLANVNDQVGIGVKTGGYSFLCRPSEKCFEGSDSDWELGWTAGAGAEYAVGSHWTIGGEYLFASLPGGSLRETATNFVSLTQPSSFDVEFDDLNVHLFRFKLNYRF